ncbi:MAG TPA: hypothetical protein PKD90_12255 [Phnomibacter sp.]|nr:hypothetical protein [Phnomibacter sp.]
MQLIKHKLPVFFMAAWMLSIQPCIFAQPMAPEPLAKPLPGTREYHLQKAKSNTTAAWVLLGSGVVAGTIGLTSFGKGFTGNNRGSGRGGALALGYGFLAPLGSIPFFIIGGNHKRTASKLPPVQPAATFTPVYHPYTRQAGLSMRLAIP